MATPSPSSLPLGPVSVPQGAARPPPPPPRCAFPRREGTMALGPSHRGGLPSLGPTLTKSLHLSLVSACVLHS